MVKQEFYCNKVRSIRNQTYNKTLLELFTFNKQPGDQKQKAINIINMLFSRKRILVYI